METMERIAIALEHIECLLTDIRDMQVKKKAVRREVLDTVENPLGSLWNQFSHESLPKVLNVNKNSPRGRNAQNRWKEKPELDHWTRVILRINASDFCRGNNSNKWVADFDWLVRPDVHYKVLEGKYDNKTLVEQKRLVGYTQESNLPVYEVIKK